MAYVREILAVGRPTLRKVAKKVRPEELNDPLFQQLIDDMFATMYHAPGIGLAAPQINVSKRLFVVDLQDDDEDDVAEEDEHDCGHDHAHAHKHKGKGGHGPLVVVNPRFTVTEGEIQSLEGCLSVPGKIGDVTRFERVVCVGLDRYGRKVELTGTGLIG
jgi:peptide deformylase